MVRKIPGIRVFSFLPLSILLLLMHFSCQSTPDPVPEVPLGEFIQSEMQREGIPSLAACIIKGNQVVWKGTYGFLDPERNRPVTEETVFLLASISKTFVATAILQLVERGLLDLHADVNVYLPFPLRNPNFPDVPITAEILLTHRSGLASPIDEDPLFYTRYLNDSAPALYPWLQNYLVPGKSQYVPAVWKKTMPGDSVLYSNIGVAVLGYLVEAVTGMKYWKYCRENILVPLRMTNSGYFLERLRDTTRLAPLYSGDTSIDHYSVRFYPSTMMRSSLRELSRYLIAYMNDGSIDGSRILTSSSVDSILRPKQQPGGFGYLWWTDNDSWTGHWGGFEGVSAVMVFHRTFKVGMIILTNQTNAQTIYQNGAVNIRLRREAEKYAAGLNGVGRKPQ